MALRLVLIRCDALGFGPLQTGREMTRWAFVESWTLKTLPPPPRNIVIVTLWNDRVSVGERNRDVGSISVRVARQKMFLLTKENGAKEKHFVLVCTYRGITSSLQPQWWGWLVLVGLVGYRSTHDVETGRVWRVTLTWSTESMTNSMTSMTRAAADRSWVLLTSWWVAVWHAGTAGSRALDSYVARTSHGVFTHLVRLEPARIVPVQARARWQSNVEVISSLGAQGSRSLYKRSICHEFLRSLIHQAPSSSLSSRLILILNMSQNIGLVLIWKHKMDSATLRSRLLHQPPRPFSKADTASRSVKKPPKCFLEKWQQSTLHIWQVFTSATAVKI